jgi:hypothetical protein
LRLFINNFLLIKYFLLIKLLDRCLFCTDRARRARFVQKGRGPIFLCKWRTSEVNKKYIMWQLYVRQTNKCMIWNAYISSLVHIWSKKTKNTNVFLFSTKNHSQISYLINHLRWCSFQSKGLSPLTDLATDSCEKSLSILYRKSCVFSGRSGFLSQDPEKMTGWVRINTVKKVVTIVVKINSLGWDPVYTRAKDSGFITKPKRFGIGFIHAFTLTLVKDYVFELIFNDFYLRDLLLIHDIFASISTRMLIYCFRLL